LPSENPSDLSKFLQSVIDPYFTVVRPLAEQERPPHAASDAVVPASEGRVNQVRTCNRLCRISWSDPHNLSNRKSRAKCALHVLYDPDTEHWLPLARNNWPAMLFGHIEPATRSWAMARRITTTGHSSLPPFVGLRRPNLLQFQGIRR